MNDRSPTEIIHGIIEEQEERELTLMIEEQIERQRKQEATQLVNTTAGNYARVAEVMRRDGIELNGQNCLVIRTRALDMLAARRQREQRQNAAPYQWKKPERVRWKNAQTQVNERTQRCCDIGLIR